MKAKKRNDWVPGYCYVFYDRQAKLHKFGLSRDWKRRQWYLNKEYGVTLGVRAIAYTPNMRLMEKTLHSIFQKRRYYREGLNGAKLDGATEWFAVRGVSAIAAFYSIALLVWLGYITIFLLLVAALVFPNLGRAIAAILVIGFGVFMRFQ